MGAQWRAGGDAGGAGGTRVDRTGAAGFTGGLLGAAYWSGDASLPGHQGVWLGVTVVFLLFWLFGLLAELQRSETIDLQKLMHLPVALGQLFVVNYLVSHFSLSIVIMVPVMLGLGIGLTVTRGPEWSLMLPLALSMVLMITAWTYCLRGWLASLMSNPRRRRTVIMCITMTFILLAQGPNLYFNLLPHARDHRASRDQNAALQHSFQQLAAVQAFIPPLWVPVVPGAWRRIGYCPRCMARWVVWGLRPWACAGPIACRSNFIPARPVANSARAPRRSRRESFPPPPPPPRAAVFSNGSSRRCRNNPPRWPWPPFVPCCGHQR